MDRSELNRDLEFPVGPVSERTVPASRTHVPAPLHSLEPLLGETVAANPAKRMSAPGAMTASVGPAPHPFYPPPGYAPAPAVEVGRFYWAKRAARWLSVAACLWLCAVVFLVFVYRFVDPPVSALMLRQRLASVDYDQQWVTLEAISPNAVRAVIVSEDARFCQHWGVDYDAMQTAIERAGTGGVRGASTISMQVTKNLFLWSSKSYVRKLIEIPLTYLIEAWWPKRRIMEVYLNIAEWGPGVFGVEAAARHHFGKSALRLTPREGAQLAAALPNPIRRDAGEPGPQTRRLAGLVQARASSAPRAVFACVSR